MTKKHDHKHHDPHEHPTPPASEEPSAQTPPPSEGEAPSQPAEAVECQSLRRERDDLLARLQRLSADYVNYQKRASREISDAREYANADLLKNLLPLLDDMDRAIETAAQTHGDDDALFMGVKLVRKKAMEILSRFGLEPIRAEGQPFNPGLHEALMQQPSAEALPQTILKELRAGYSLKGRTLRPAGVVVSMPAKPSEEKSPEQP